jgi:hypothetical protein
MTMADDPADSELYKALRDLAAMEIRAVSVRPPAVSHRPNVAAVETDEHGSDTTVTVKLQLGDNGFSGSARGPSNIPAICRSAAEATLRALDDVLAGVALARIDWLDSSQSPSFDQPHIMHVAVLFRTADGEDLLIGSAVIRGVEYEAAVRATLDAVNRQVEMLLRSTADD